MSKVKHQNDRLASKALSGHCDLHSAHRLLASAENTMTPENWLCGVAAITAAGMRFVLSSAAMSAQQSSFGHNGVPWHMLAPIMPVRDKNDLQRREENFRSSITACPSCWRNYFEVLATQLHREMN